MDTKIHRPQPQCSRTGRPFVPGDSLVSALVRSPEGLLRVDYEAAAWAGPPEKCLAWWRCAYPRPDGAGNVLAPSDTLLDLVEQLEAEPAEATLRYLLALELVRRRVLRFLDPSGDDAPDGHLRLGCRKRDAEYLVAVAPPSPESAKEAEVRLTALLWSGEAA